MTLNNQGSHLGNPPFLATGEQSSGRDASSLGLPCTLGPADGGRPPPRTTADLVHKLSKLCFKAWMAAGPRSGGLFLELEGAFVIT